MKKIFFPNSGRGITKLDWLKSYHSFSFGDFYNPHLTNFGALCVLNEDIVKAGKGFGMHPHDNMEIITIILDGEIEHKDSAGHKSTIKQGQIQRMSAGSGVMHSEYNNSDKDVHLLQIWILTKEKGVKPSYEYADIGKFENGKLKLVASCDKKSKKKSRVYIHQDAFMSIGEIEKSKSVKYELHNQDANNGVYVFAINGSVDVEGQMLKAGDAVGITGAKSVKINTKENSKLLVIEVPMD